MGPTETSDDGLQGIRDSEQLLLHAYPDVASPLARATPAEPWGFKPAPQILQRLPLRTQILSGKPWTLGYGNTQHPSGGPVQPGDTCTRDEAEVWLRLGVAPYERAVTETITKIELNQRMFDALVNFAWNVGEAAFRRSTLAKRLNEGRFIEAQAEFDRWVNAGGRRLHGLVARRNLEQAWFNGGIRQALMHDKDALANFEHWLAEAEAGRLPT